MHGRRWYWKIARLQDTPANSGTLLHRMNRATVVFIALAILLAHTLAIHQNPDGDFAAPYDWAHVAYRLGRNLVYEGRALWDPQGGWVESYPSVVWIGVSAVAERLYVSPTLTTQWLGILSALATVVIMAQFSPTRMAGLIAPTLLAASGSAAAAAASGTEAGFAMVLATVTFLAFERRWKGVLALSLGVLVLTRPEGAPFLGSIVLLEYFDRPRLDTDERCPPFRRALLLPVVPLLVLSLLRTLANGNVLSPFGKTFSHIDPERWMLGFHYLWSFVSASGSGVLLALPLLFALAGKLAPTGRRALILFLVWCAVVVASGGNDLPFWNALAPALPLFFVAVQDAVTQWMDRRPTQAPLAWMLLILATSASFLVSRHPGDIGPLPLERLQRAWMQPTETLYAAYPRRLGRMGLMEEIRQVERLRPLGLFLRNEVEPDSTIATFWPGAIGYLSRRPVLDILGRTTPLPGETRTRAWSGNPKVDLIEALGEPADYMVPLIGTLGEAGSTSSFLRAWLERYDRAGVSEKRRGELLSALRRFELVAVPVLEKSHQPDIPSKVPFLLLRRVALGLAPQIEVERDGLSFDVTLQHQGHAQVVDLSVSLIDKSGATWSMRPTGAWVRAAGIRARTDILVYNTGPRRIRLLSGTLPDIETSWLSVRLNNTGVEWGSPLSWVGSPVLIRLR